MLGAKIFHPVMQQFRDSDHPLKRHITLQQIGAAKSLGNVVVFTVRKGRLKSSVESPFANKFKKLMKRQVSPELQSCFLMYLLPL